MTFCARFRWFSNRIWSQFATAVSPRVIQMLSIYISAGFWFPA